MKILHLCAAIALLQIAPSVAAQDTQPRTEPQPRTHPQQPTAPQPARQESNQEMTDAWITAKVKSALLADEDVSGLEIDVETRNGVVTLTGMARTQSEIAEARRIAQNIDGVKQVDIRNLKRVDGTR